MTELNYNSPSALRSFLDENGLGMRKRYGQNFLLDPGIRRSLVDALEVQTGTSVWEIGPGLGAMTGLLLEKGLFVKAFEIDSGFVRILRERYADKENFTLVEGDVLKTWFDNPPAPYLLGNLPYNIAAALLADFIENGRFFKRIVVTVQREVARRMAALPGSADYSSFSVLCASAYRVQPLMVIKSASFYPRPRVDSQAVLMERREDAPILPACFFPLLRCLFSSRRKTIKNNLRGFLPAAQMAQVFEKSGLDGGRRAEELTIEDFEHLAHIIENMVVS